MKSESGRVRVLLSKVGLDAHDIGIKVVAKALRDAGMEVIYLGIYQTPERVAAAALQEDVDIIGVSFHAPVYFTVATKLLNWLKEKGINHIPLIIGGVIPRQDIPRLKDIGVKEVFTEGFSTEYIVEYIKDAVGKEK